MRAIGRETRCSSTTRDGAELVDVDGNRYVDWVCSWGPLIHGHAHPPVVAAVAEAAGARHDVRRADRGRGRRWPRRCAGACESVEMLRMTSSGTEAAMSAIRLARAATGRERLLKFAGAYHGHVDGLLAEAGSGLATQGIPASPGVPESAVAATRHRALERPGGRARGGRGRAVRRDPGRALAGEHGPRAARAAGSSKGCASWPTRTARC